MRYLIEHQTRLAFPRPVREHQCEMRVAPRPNGQTVIALELGTEPAAELATYVDAFGNTVHWFGVVEPHDALTTTLRARVETALANPFAFAAVEPAHERAWLDEALWREPRLWDYVFHRSPATPDLEKLRFAQPFPAPVAGAPLLQSVLGASEWVREHLRYDPEATDVHAPLAEVLTAGAGVCQDFAHLLVAIVRTWGVPARYAAGYVDPLGGAEADEDEGGDEGAGGLRAATHAWAVVLAPGAGWRGFAATTGLVVNYTYITAAVGRYSTYAAPQRGSFKGEDPGSEPEVCVRVTRED